MKALENDMDEKQILTILNKTELGIKLKKIEAIYEKLERNQKYFSERFDVHCKLGCGICCEHFIPDITNLEAGYLALGLISEGRDDEVVKMLQKRDPDNPICPLYNQDDELHHCTVYKWRPLICRLFGAAASRNKEGQAVFKNCKWNENTHEVTTKSLESHKKDLVVMGDFGWMLEEAEAGDVQTALLPDALERAISKARLMLELEEKSEKMICKNRKKSA